MESDKEFLQWVHGRMVNMHKEDPQVDYMRKLQAIIDRTPNDQRTPNVSKPQQKDAYGRRLGAPRR